MTPLNPNQVAWCGGPRGSVTECCRPSIRHILHHLYRATCHACSISQAGFGSQSAEDQASGRCCITHIKPLAMHALCHELFLACREQPDILSVGCWNGTLSQYNLDGKQVGKAKDLGFMPCCVSYMPNGTVLQLGLLSHAYLECFPPCAYLHRMSSYTCSGQASFIAYHQITFVTPTTCCTTSPALCELT